MKRLLQKSMLCILLSGLLMIQSGCGKSVRDDVDVEATQMKLDGDKLIAEGTVRYFFENDGEYLTEQLHLYNLSQNCLQITSKEPQGTFKWILSDGSFSSDVSAPKLMDKNTAMLLLTTAASSDTAELNGQNSGPVKIDGLWYDSITLKSNENPQFTTILYKNKQNSRVEVVTVSDATTGCVLLAKSYNLRQFKKSEMSFPAKIDVFSTENTTGPRKLLLQIEYHAMEFKAKGY